MKVITIGRDHSNDIVIHDPKVSRMHHLQIVQTDEGRFFASDMQSTNGTYVNGKRISTETELFQCDIIRIGETILPWQNYFDTTRPHVESTMPKSADLPERMDLEGNKYATAITMVVMVGLICECLCLIGTMIFEIMGSYESHAYAIVLMFSYMCAASSFILVLCKKKVCVYLYMLSILINCIATSELYNTPAWALVSSAVLGVVFGYLIMRIRNKKGCSGWDILRNRVPLT